MYIATYICVHVCMHVYMYAYVYKCMDICLPGICIGMHTLCWNNYSMQKESG